MTDAPENTDLPQDLPFAQALSELESLATRLEEAPLQLEEALAAYRRGTVLLNHCQRQLDAAEAEINVIDGGEARTIKRADLIANVKVGD